MQARFKCRPPGRLHLPRRWRPVNAPILSLFVRITHYVEKLKNFGHEIANVSDEQLDVKAPEHEIFELLSGQHIYL